jgi:hypothetical protein
MRTTRVGPQPAAPAAEQSVGGRGGATPEATMRPIPNALRVEPLVDESGREAAPFDPLTARPGGGLDRATLAALRREVGVGLDRVILWAIGLGAAGIGLAVVVVAVRVARALVGGGAPSWGQVATLGVVFLAAQAGLGLAWRVAKQERGRRVAPAMLRRGRCPHCAGQLAGEDGRASCPRCGGRWRVPPTP